MSINIGGTVYPITEDVEQTTRQGHVALALGEAGPRGDKGDVGPSGPSGPSGPRGKSAYEVWLEAGNTGSLEVIITSLQTGGPVVSGSYYVHRQGTPSDFWVIDHPLNRVVAIAVVDSAGSVVEGDPAYVSESRVTISFSAPFAGEAYLT